MGDGLGEFGGLFVVKDSGFVVEGGEAVEGGVEGEFVILGQAVERPAAPFFDDVAVDIKAGAGENNIAAAAGAFFVADSVNHGKGETGDGSDDVGVGVFAVAITGGELVAGAVGVEDFFEIIGRKAVVGVEDKIGVVERGLGGGLALIRFGENLFYGFVEGVAFALALWAGANDNGSTVFTTDFDGGIFFRFDNDEDI